MLPSLNSSFRSGQRVKPRILILEIRNKSDPRGKVLGGILIEREEIYRHIPGDGEPYEASICLSYQRISSKHSYHQNGNGRFDGSYSRISNAVSLTSSSMSKGAVFLDLPGLSGQRIGTYLMNEVVQWAQQWPQATVNRIELLAAQASDVNKPRRNRFYEQFGLIFDYTDPDHREGKSRPIQAGALVLVETWKENIVERQIIDYLETVLSTKDKVVIELEAKNHAYGLLAAERTQAATNPLYWAFRQLYYRHINVLIIGILITFVAALMWISA